MCMAGRARRRGVHVYTEMPDRAPGKGKEREREGKERRGKERKRRGRDFRSVPFPSLVPHYSKKCMNAMFPAEETAFLTFPVAGL